MQRIDNNIDCLKVNEEEYGKRGRQEQEEERLERGKSERCFLSKTCTVESLF